MRILLVTMDYPPPMGGIQMVTRNLQEDLVATGNTVRLLNFDGRNTSNFGRLRISDFFFGRATRNRYFRIRTLLSPARMLKPTGFRDFVFHNLIYRIALRERASFVPDIVHIMKPTLHASIVDYDGPIVVSCHGSEVEDTFPVRYSLKRASRIHCVSEHVKRVVERIIEGRNEHIRVIPNSVDVGYFSDMRSKPREKVILTCCRLTDDKNVDSVLRAVSHLPDHLAREFRHVIIGDGPRRPHLKRLSKHLGLRNVEFVGEIRDRTHLIDWLCRAWLFVLCPRPTRGQAQIVEEGFGISYIEAQAAGLPVIGSAIGGIPESVGSGGLLVTNPTDPAEIADAIQSVLESTELYNRLRENAHSRISQFDRKNAIRKFTELYQEAIEAT